MNFPNKKSVKDKDIDPSVKTSDALKKKSLLEKMRERDKPILATPDAHGPG